MGEAQRIATSLLVVLIACAGSRADTQADARAHYERGTTLYDIGQYRDAAREYEEAYKLHNDPALLFNIGQAYRAAHLSGDAINAYRAYLRRLPNARNRSDVEDHIRRLQQELDAAPATTPPPTTTPAPAAEKRPLYKKWWLWTAVGAAAVVVVGVGVGVAYAIPKDAPAPPSALPVTF